MSRKPSERRRVQVIVRQEAELRAARDKLAAEVAGCYGSDCPCHEQQWRELEQVRFLLGDEDQR